MKNRGNKFRKYKGSLNNLNVLAYFILLLIFILTIFIILNIGGLTGRASTDYGYVNITIETGASINFTTNAIDFGSGQVDGGVSKALINSNGVSENGTWNYTNDSLHLENIGNVNVSLELSIDSDVDTFLGGTSPAYQWNISNNESNSCTANASISLDTYFDANSTAVGICSVLNYEDSNDSIFINVGLTIPSDSNTGNLSSTITATATTAA